MTSDVHCARCGRWHTPPVCGAVVDFMSGDFDRLALDLSAREEAEERALLADDRKPGEVE